MAQDIKQYQKEYRQKNANKLKDYKRQWNIANRNKLYLYHKDWAATHPEQVRLSRKKYRKKNLKQHAVNEAKRRAAKASASRNDLTSEQWKEIQAAYNFQCVYCGRKMKRLTQDHITPLSQGGNHTATNIVPACQTCNSRKLTGPPLVPIQPLFLTLAAPKS